MATDQLPFPWPQASGHGKWLWPVAIAMAPDHCHWRLVNRHGKRLWPIAVARGNGHKPWPWLLAMANAHAHWRWSIAIAAHWQWLLTGQGKWPWQTDHGHSPAMASGLVCGQPSNYAKHCNWVTSATGCNGGNLWTVAELSLTWEPLKLSQTHGSSKTVLGMCVQLMHWAHCVHEFRVLGPWVLGAKGLRGPWGLKGLRSPAANYGHLRGAMAIGHDHDHWQWPLTSGHGYGQWPWPLAMVIGQGHFPCPIAMSPGHGH